MHDVIQYLNMNIALHAERMHHDVNIYILLFHGLMGQSTVNIVMCLCHDDCISYEVLSLQCTVSNNL